MNRALNRLLQGMQPCVSRVGMGISRKRARRDFAGDIFEVVAKDDVKGLSFISSHHATWPHKLQLAIKHGRLSGSGIPELHWVDAISTSLSQVGIEWALDVYKGRISSQHIVTLGGLAPTTSVSRKIVGTLALKAERARIADERAIAMRLDKARIDFGCNVPFKRVPQLLTDAMKQTAALFTAGGDLKVLDHYQIAINCLSQCIGDPICDLMLMLALTVAASSETPHVGTKEFKFTVGSRRKDPGQLCLVMVTRMLWYFQPKSFPWKKGTGGPAHDVGEMTKKIGKVPVWVCPC